MWDLLLLLETNDFAPVHESPLSALQVGVTSNYKQLFFLFPGTFVMFQGSPSLFLHCFPALLAITGYSKIGNNCMQSMTDLLYIIQNVHFNLVPGMSEMYASRLV